MFWGGKAGREGDIPRIPTGCGGDCQQEVLGGRTAKALVSPGGQSAYDATAATTGEDSIGMTTSGESGREWPGTQF